MKISKFFYPHLILIILGIGFLLSSCKEQKTFKGKKEIENAISAGKINGVHFNGDILVANKGFEFIETKIKNNKEEEELVAWQLKSTTMSPTETVIFYYCSCPPPGRCLSLCKNSNCQCSSVGHIHCQCEPHLKS